MAESTSRWRSWVLLLMIFFVAAFFVEGRDLFVFIQAFREVRSGWTPVQVTVAERSMAVTERRSSSTKSGVVGHVTVYVPGARVRYTLNGVAHDLTALGWEERLRTLAQWEQSGIEAGRTLAIRVSPDSPDRATLLGAWTPASMVVFGRLILTELVLLCATLVCTRCVIRRSA